MVVRTKSPNPATADHVHVRDHVNVHVDVHVLVVVVVIGFCPWSLDIGVALIGGSKDYTFGV
jgi:hypothetical protein